MNRQAIFEAGPRWNLSTAIACAEHVVAFYGDRAEYLTRAEASGFGLAEIIDSSGVQAAIFASPELIFVVCQGSAQGRDWIDNFRSVCRHRWPEYVPGCAVGKGFLRQAQQIMPRFFSALTAYPDAKVVLTGHSLGAAVASILGFVAGAGRQVSGYVFESPRVGNESWRYAFNHRFLAEMPDRRFDRDLLEIAAAQGEAALAFAKQLLDAGKQAERAGDFCRWWSIANVQDGELDLVTRVPKRRWGFRHCGQHVVVDGGQLHVGLDAWRAFRDRHPVGNFAAWRVLTRLAKSVLAHGAQRVLNALKACQES